MTSLEPAVTDSEQELLDQLLKEGLEFDGENIPRKRKLLEVVFNACISKPIEIPLQQPSQINLERAQLTLSILERQIASLPEVLLASSTASDGGSRPLYAWLITRIIIAATHYDEYPEALALVNALCNAAVHILTVISRDLTSGGSTYMRGPQRVANILRELRTFARDSSPTLLGYTDTPSTSDSLPHLFALHIALQTPSPYACDTELSAAVILSDIGRRIGQQPPSRQARYASIVSAAIRTVPIRHVLSRAAVAIVQWPESPDDRWQASVRDLLQVVDKHGDDSLGRDVWWALYSQADGLKLVSPVSQQKVLLLLNPIPPHLTAKIVGPLIMNGNLQRWAAATNGSEHADVRERLRLHWEIPETSSLKRKRTDGHVQMKVLERLRELMPDVPMDADIVQNLPRLLTDLGPPVSFKLLKNHGLPCTLASCDAGVHKPLPVDVAEVWFKNWDSVDDDLTLMRGMRILVQHIEPVTLTSSLWPKVLWRAWRAMKSPDRQTRRAAGLLISSIYSGSLNFPAQRRSSTRIIANVQSLLKEPYPVQETAVLLIGDLGHVADDKDLADILEMLIKKLGSNSSPLRSVAYTQLMDIAAHRNKQPYNLLLPHLDRMSVLLAELLVTQPLVVGEAMQFIGYNRQAFFNLEASRKNVVPTLVLRRNRPALEALASILGEPLAAIIINEAAIVQAKIFFHPSETARALDFAINVINENMDPNIPPITVEKYVRLALVNFVVIIVVELGDYNEEVQQLATAALSNVLHTVRHDGDLGSFLKPHMLGILHHMSDQLVLPRTTADQKNKIIRSIGKLVELVGDSMASFSPQVRIKEQRSFTNPLIIASLQSTLDVPDLRYETLRTWYVFIDFLKFADVGPFIGPTIAALVENWSAFDPQQRVSATKIIKVISGNASHLKAFQDDIVRFDHVAELAPYSNALLRYREQWSTKTHLKKLIDRTDSNNLAVSTASMREVRDLVQSKYTDIVNLARGDMFDPVVGNLITSLLGAATRDGECDELKDLAYECFGLIGALDPDRFQTDQKESSLMIMSNFADHEESITFAIHLIEKLLVGAFRTTNDTKHQNRLSFVLQELLKFCGFDQRLVNRSGSVPTRTRQRWDRLGKDVLETVTPLLNAQYQHSVYNASKLQYPIYPTMSTYREWLQAWTVDLIGRVQDLKNPTDTNGDAKQIFGVFNTEPKSMDVAVAHHLLPHLVLHILLSGDDAAREQIKSEIHCVLYNQVSPDVDSAPEKRTLSAQVIFELMDHLSKWLRQARVEDRHERRSSSRNPVDKLLSSIDTELAANAAMKSRAFARSLRNFEERIVYLRTSENRKNAELQPYYESLHEIYAELDEPDGMEGVSAYVVSPTLELQIREHESTGRWTAAQSCWEVRLQHSPEDVKFQVGLLKCLQNLGHYDSIRTHVRGVISNMQGPDMRKELVPFQAEAAWTIGDWQTVAQTAKSGPPIADVFLAIREGKNINEALVQARREIGSMITTREYSRAYDAVLQLHMLREVEMIHSTDLSIATARDNRNAGAVVRRYADELIATLADRFDMALPVFRVREEVLNKRRAAFSLMNSNRLRGEQGPAWIQSAKIARKAGYEQTAYSATLQAHEADAPFTFIQAAKLIHKNGDILKGLRELENPIAQLVKEADNPGGGIIDLTDAPKTEDDFRRHRSLAKAVLLEARWSHEADRFEQNDVIRRFRKATELGGTLESPYFHLGRYYDTLASNVTNLEEISAYNHFTCLNYQEALQRGVKYIYQTMPRLLTVWLDLGDKPESKKNATVSQNFQHITKLMDKSRGKIQTYQYLTAFPQIVSRITHQNKEVRDVLIKIIARVIRDYPAQALWPIVGAMQSKRKDRQEVTESILLRAKGSAGNTELANRIQDARRLSTMLLRLAEDKPDAKAREASINTKYPYVKKAFPSTMIMPLQDALTCVLPTPGSVLKAHQAFPVPPVEIKGIVDRVDIMPSLQQPKKLVFIGTDGNNYPFLCKPHDDLRKDARLMDLNSMINKFLNSASESRRRHLYVRTYAVMPLNEECGLLEWVSHTNALKSILEKNYARKGIRIYSNDIYTNLDGARKGSNWQVDVPHVFKTKVLPLYKPTVFNDWFLNTWPEPTAWLTSRTNYARTLAVMSMIGYVLGLGDRHGENILFDGLSGDTVHVDLNCLFDKAKTFEVPERVPFRLTHNMVGALGVTGVEGVFRKAAEITMEILRSNGDSLMSVLEAFVHDPLVEWTKSRKHADRDVRVTADKNLRPIQKKLRGVIGEVERSVPNQVEILIREATSATNLGLMYVGWAAWL